VVVNFSGSSYGGIPYLLVQTREGTTYYLDRPLDAHTKAFQRCACLRFTPTKLMKKKLGSFSDAFLVGKDPVELFEPSLDSCFLSAEVTSMERGGGAGLRSLRMSTFSGVRSPSRWFTLSISQT
jgi:hypothetical protein